MFDFLEEELNQSNETKVLKSNYQSLTPRHLIVAPKNKSIVAVDFRNQELYFLAVLSGDKAMQKAFTSADKLPYLDDNSEVKVDKDGNKLYYPNPYCDLHTITAKECCFPEIFKGVPEDKWISVAKDKKKIKLLGDARYYAKKTNFGIVYLQSPETMAQQAYVRVERTKVWRRNHEKLFVDCHRWIAEQKNLAEARGWARTATGRQRWVREDNSKSQGASPGRSGVNHCIQGLGAELGKRCLVALTKKYQGTPVRLLSLIHDEVIVEVPGNCTRIKDAKGISYQPDKEVLYWANQVEQILQQTQTELLDEIALEGDEGKFKGKTSKDIGKYWSH